MRNELRRLQARVMPFAVFLVYSMHCCVDVVVFKFPPITLVCQQQASAFITVYPRRPTARACFYIFFVEMGYFRRC